jgi:uncharacterized protein YndB with AHSA1/START domain
MRILAPITILLVATITFHLASAEVADSAENGFMVKNEAVIAASPDKVYATLLHIGNWWDPEHTYSGDSRNMSIDARPGGCFCERLPHGGGVQHMTIVYLSPGKVLRMSGALGPLQRLGVAGSLDWKMNATDGGTRLELSYTVGGYRSGGLRELAAPVDSVLRGQLLRLKSFVETGHATAN